MAGGGTGEGRSKGYDSGKMLMAEEMRLAEVCDLGNWVVSRRGILEGLEGGVVADGVEVCLAGDLGS